MRKIKREDLLSNVEYAEILNKEKHHNHEIIEDDFGTLRWAKNEFINDLTDNNLDLNPCLLYTSPSPRDGLLSRMPSSA